MKELEQIKSHPSSITVTSANATLRATQRSLSSNKIFKVRVHSHKAGIDGSHILGAFDKPLSLQLNASNKTGSFSFLNEIYILIQAGEKNRHYTSRLCTIVLKVLHIKENHMHTAAVLQFYCTVQQDLANITASCELTSSSLTLHKIKEKLLLHRSLL